VTLAKTHTLNPAGPLSSLSRPDLTDRELEHGQRARNRPAHLESRAQPRDSWSDPVPCTARADGLPIADRADDWLADLGVPPVPWTLLIVERRA